MKVNAPLLQHFIFLLPKSRMLAFKKVNVNLIVSEFTSLINPFSLDSGFKSNLGEKVNIMTLVVFAEAS